MTRQIIEKTLYTRISMCLVHITLINWYFRNISKIFTFSKILLDILLCRVIQNILDTRNTEIILTLLIIEKTLYTRNQYVFRPYNTITVVFSIYYSKYSLFPKFWWIFFFVGSFTKFQRPETLKNILYSHNHRKNIIYSC